MTKTLDLNLVWIAATVLMLLLIGCYIFQMGQLAQYKYQLRDYEKELINLSKKKDSLDINLSRANSLTQVEEYLMNKDFVKSSQVTYIRVSEGSVATNK